MPIKINRESLTKNLEQRYATDHAGGAFDVKTDIVDGGQYNKRATNKLEDAHTEAGFKTRMGLMETELDEAKGTVSKESSLYMQGFNNTKYSDSKL